MAYVLVDADGLESLNDFAPEAFDTLCDMPTCIEDMVDAEFPGALTPVVPELPEGWHWKVEEPDHVEAVYMGTGLSVAIHDGDLSVFDFYNNGDVAGLGAVLPVIARFQALQGGAE